MQVTIKNKPQIDLDISYVNKLIYKAYDTKFLGIYVDLHCLEKNHVEQITHKLSAACYAMKSVISQETLKRVHYAYVHSIMNYRIIFWETLHIVQKFLNTKKYN